MRRLDHIFIISLTLLCTSPAPAAEEAMLGFSSAGAEVQQALETDYRSLLSASDQATWSKQLSSHPHHAGSPHNRENAEYLAGLFKGWGYQVDIEEFEILFPVPVSRELELLEPGHFQAVLREDEIAGDDSTAARDEVLPPYNAFSADGEVTGDLVYVNYGLPDDYEMLERYGIDVTGKIVIAKYGRAWRGIKPKLAAEKGAKAAILYSDPADDGYAQGDVYPKGSFKNSTAVQRGSVMDITLYPGDVLTPGRGAVKGSRRLSQSKAATLVSIPVLPISYADAQPLLSALDGEVAPPSWRGALPITYHLGPGPARVRLKMQSDWQRITIRDVIARLPGTLYPQQWVIRGNHQDSWNHGAQDPVSGLVALMDEAKAVASLAAAGRPPARTVIYTVWDAEEPGLIGSTEWVEQHQRELGDKTVAYINSDENSRGFVRMAGSHTLESFFNQIGSAVIDPETGVSVITRQRAATSVFGNERARTELVSSKGLRLGALGSGSDFSPFLQHLGIASANLGFSGESPGGSYHTLYDTYEHFIRFDDPGFRYGQTLAELAGMATLRLANARVLPFRFTNLAETLQIYLKELENLSSELRDQAKTRQQMLSNGDYMLAMDPEKTFFAPKPLTEVPYFNFAQLQNVLVTVEQEARDLDATLDGLDPEKLSKKKLESINRKLYLSERKLSSEAGLPGREWYRHQIYAPGMNTGYGVKTLPRVRETIEAGQYDHVNDEIDFTARVLKDFAKYIGQIRESIENGLQ